MTEKQSLNLEGLNLENGGLKYFQNQQRNKNQNFQENIVSTAAKDEEQTALRRATLLKQKIISTELKLDSLKKQEVYKEPFCELCYESQLDELNIKLYNYMGALDKEIEKSSSVPIKDIFCSGLLINPLGKRRSVAIGEKLKCQNHPFNNMEDAAKSRKNPLRAISHFIDAKIRGHKRVKSDECKASDCNQIFRPRTLTNPFYNNESDNYIINENLIKSNVEQSHLRSEIDPNAIAEIEAFEKLIKDYFDHHHSYTF